RPGSALLDKGGDKLLFPGCFVIVIGGCRCVIGPCGRSGICRTKRSYPGMKLTQHGLQTRKGQATPLGSKAHLTIAGGVFLEICWQNHIGQHFPSKTATHRQQPGEIVRSDSFQIAAVPGVMSDVEMRAKQERIQELLAELPVAQPKITVPIWPNREMIDEDRLSPLKLNIIG